MMNSKEKPTEEKKLASTVDVCRDLKNIIKSSFGPNGMSKMMVRKTGTPIVTNDCGVILDEMDVNHPTINVIEDHIIESDSLFTATELLLLAELVEKANELIGKGVHRNTIVDAYHNSCYRTVEVLNSESIHKSINRELIRNLIKTRLIAKMVYDEQNNLTDTILNSVYPNKKIYNINAIDVHTIPGGTHSESQTIAGVSIEKRRPLNSGRVSLPIHNVNILLTNDSISIPELRSETKIDTEVDIIKQVVGNELEKKQNVAKYISSTGCDVLLTGSRDNIDPQIQRLLSDQGIVAFHQIDKDVMLKLAETTNAKINKNIWDIQDNELGFAERVGRINIGDEKSVYVENSTPDANKTIIIRGGTEKVVHTYEEAVTECLQIIDSIRTDQRLLPTGGASEMTAATELRKWSTSIGSRKQLAVEAYADCLQSIPVTLAENAGMNSRDALIELRNKHSNGKTSFGVSCLNNQITDSYKDDLFEPFSEKSQSITMATEIANMLIRVDDIILTENDHPSFE